MFDTDIGPLVVQERGVIPREAIHTYIYEYVKHLDLLKRTLLNIKMCVVLKMRLTLLQCGQ